MCCCGRNQAEAGILPRGGVSAAPPSLHQANTRMSACRGGRLAWLAHMGKTAGPREEANGAAPGSREVEARGGPARRWSHDDASVREGGEGGGASVEPPEVAAANFQVAAADLGARARPRLPARFGAYGARGTSVASSCRMAAVHDGHGGYLQENRERGCEGEGRRGRQEGKVRGWLPYG